MFHAKGIAKHKIYSTNLYQVAAASAEVGVERDDTQFGEKKPETE